MLTTRDHIIDVSAAIFRKKGYAGAGIKEILNEADVPRGSLYHYFPMGKEQLALAVLHQARTQKTEQFRLALYRKDVESALFNIVQLTIDDLTKSGYRMACPIFSLGLAVDGQHRELQQAAADILQDWETQLIVFYKKRKVEEAEAKVGLFLSALDGAAATCKIYKCTDRLVLVQNNTHLFI